jgi:hypothetical protein
VLTRLMHPELQTAPVPLRHVLNHLVIRRQANASVDIGAFMHEYGMECPRAAERLLRDGVPLTTLHARVDDRANAGAAVAEATQVCAAG